MHTALWVIQIILGLAFLMAGIMKLTKSAAELKEAGGDRMAWVDDLTPAQLKTVGALEALGGIGLVLPPALGVLPILAPIAAVGLALTMVGAIAVHARRSEYGPSIAGNVMLGGLAVFIAVGRFGAQAF